ncbi:MAG TPA: isochorismatase family cysteine hydrolase [Vicinamibacterales bacterium]|nr:isochorismatase family cysteine hydrolase [Vicinamibacterales bacterium]
MTDHEKVQELIRVKEQAPLTFDPQQSALIVVDVQRYFARSEYAFAQVTEKMVPGLTDGYFERVRSGVLGNIKRLQSGFRSAGLPVIFLAFGCHMADGRDLPAWLSGFDQLGQMLLDKPGCPRVGDDSWQIDDEVVPLPGEVVLSKASSGALSTTKLDQLLRNAGINSLVVCGLTTAVCVTQTARETADRGFRVIVASDACTEMSEEMHKAALFTFGYVFGRVKSTEEIVDLLGAAKSAA